MVTDESVAGSVDYLAEPPQSSAADGPGPATALLAAADPAIASDLPRYRTYRDTDYVSSGVGGLRGNGSGILTVSGVLGGNVETALLIWQGPTNSLDSRAGASITFDGVAVEGTNIGFSNDNCWGFDNSQAYRADVTDLVGGDGSYPIAGLVNTATGADANGASLFVFFDDGDDTNDRHVTIYNGNDSNIDNPYDASGWNATLDGFLYETGGAALELHVADGQTFLDDAVTVNQVTIAPPGSVFQGNTVPGIDGPGGNGKLWDIRSFGLVDVLQFGDEQLRLTSGVSGDCLSLVAAAVITEATPGIPMYNTRPLDEQFGIEDTFGFSDDPVNTAVGNFVAVEADLTFTDTLHGLDWVRTYNARDDLSGPLGRGWTFAHDARLVAIDGSSVTLRLADGRRVRFFDTGVGTYTRPDEFDGEFRQTGTGYSVDWYNGDRWDFNADGLLVAMASWDGQSVTLTHGPDGPTTIASNTGVGLTVMYTAGRLSGLSATDGRSIAYGYDANGNLSTVTKPDGQVNSYRYDAENRLVEAYDAAGVLVVRNTYDEQDRVVGQELAGGSEATLTYDDATGVTIVDNVTAGETMQFGHDPRGRLTEIVDPDGNAVTLERQGDGELARAVTRIGEEVLRSYDERGKLLVDHSDERGTRTIEYDTLSRVRTYTEPWGARTTFEYEGAERIPSRVIDGLGNVSTFDVVDGLIRSTTDADGVTTTREYDAQRRLVASSDGAGNRTTYETDPAGRVTAVVTPLGNRTTVTYDDAGRVLATTEPTGDTTSNVWGAAGRLGRVIDPSGAETSYEYDSSGRLEAVTDPRGARVEYAYDQLDQLRSISRPSGATTTNDWSVLGRLGAVTDALGNTTSFSYDAAGNRVGTTDALGATSSSTVDGAGRVISSTDALGRTIENSYDEFGRLVTSTDAVGSVTYGYDSLGRRSTVTEPTGGVTTTTHTSGGRIATVTDPVGSTTRYTYDAAGRLETVVAPSGSVSSYTYDADGNVIATTRPTGDATTRAFDAAGRVITSTNPAGVTSAVTYGPDGGIATSRLAGDGIVTYERDDRDLLGVVDALGNATELGYDDRGNLVSVTDALGRTSTAAFDLTDRRSAVTDALGNVSEIERDALGRVVVRRDASGRTVTDTLDAVGQVVIRTYGDGSTVSFDYDAAGRRIAMHDPTGTSTYEWDASSRLRSVAGPAGDVVAYAYDAAGRVVSIAYPSGASVTHTYDIDGRLVRADHSTAGATEYTYDADGRLLDERLADGTSRSYTYADGRLATMTQNGATTTLVYDDAGRVASTVGDDARQFGYDAAGQLISADGPGGPSNYSYDAVGNAASRDGVGWSFDDANGLESSTDGTTYEHDDAGRLIHEHGIDGTREFRYDAAGRLVQEVISTGGEVATDVCADLTPTITGTPGPDVLVGTSRPDVILGLGGDDVIDGGNGNDIICGGPGNDTVNGGNGLDVVDGGDDDDILYGDNGKDEIIGAAGNDSLFGGDGADVLVGSAGTDALYGGTGPDELDGGSGIDTLDGGNGPDTCEDEPTAVDCEQFVQGEAADPRIAATTVIDRTFDGEGLLTLVEITRPDATVDVYELVWDRVRPLPEVLSITENGERIDLVHGAAGVLAVSSTAATPMQYSVLGDVLDQAGVPGVGIHFDPWGRTIGETEITVGLGYRGELHVGDLIHLRNRELDPATGRFLTRDPLSGVAGTTTVTNQYSYALNDPINHADPSGLRATDEALRAPVSYGTATPEVVTLHFTPDPDRGSVRVGLYIPTETAGLPGIDAARSHGDDRGPSPYAHLTRYRAVATIDYEAGRAEFRINPSCGTGGPPDDCHNPLPIIDDFGSVGRWWQRVPLFVDDSNRVKLDSRTDGSFYIRWAILNSDKRLIAPAIDGNVTLFPVGQRSLCVEYHRDSYPALEIYQYRYGRPPHDLFLQEAAWGADRGLLPLPFTDTHGSTCAGDDELAPGPFGGAGDMELAPGPSGDPFPTGPVV